MTRTLFDLTYALAKRLGEVVTGVADGGGTSTLEDSVGLASYPDDYFNSGLSNVGTLWILEAGAADPELDIRKVTDFVSSGGVVSAGTAFSGGASAASGDRYAIANGKYPLDKLIQFINTAVQTHTGKVETVDETVTTAADTLEYALPVVNMDIQSIWIEYETDDWRQIHNWTPLKTATGTVDKIQFHNQPLYAKSLRIIHLVPHGDLYASTDQLDESISFELVVAEAWVQALEDESAQFGKAVRATLRENMSAALQYRKTMLETHFPTQSVPAPKIRTYPGL